MVHYRMADNKSNQLPRNFSEIGKKLEFVSNYELEYNIYKDQKYP